MNIRRIIELSTRIFNRYFKRKIAVLRYDISMFSTRKLKMSLTYGLRVQTFLVSFTN